MVEYVSEFTCLGKTFSNKDQGSFTDLPVSMILILAGKREDTHAVWWLGCLSSALLEPNGQRFHSLREDEKAELLFTLKA